MNNQRNIYLVLGLSLGVLFYMTMAPSTDPTTALLLSLAVGIIFVSVGINLNEDEDVEPGSTGESKSAEDGLANTDTHDGDNPEDAKS